MIDANDLVSFLFGSAKELEGRSVRRSHTIIKYVLKGRALHSATTSSVDLVYILSLRGQERRNFELCCTY